MLCYVKKPKISEAPFSRIEIARAYVNKLFDGKPSCLIKNVDISEVEERHIKWSLISAIEAAEWCARMQRLRHKPGCEEHFTFEKAGEKAISSGEFLNQKSALYEIDEVKK